MLLLNKTSARQGSGLRLLLVMFAIVASPNALAQGRQRQSDQSNVPEVPNQGAEATVPEGRSAVDFYRRQEAPDNDPRRLSDKFLQYPVDPVGRVRPLLEIGDAFLGNGPIRPGIKTPLGEMLQPWFLLFGTFRTALQSFDNGDQNTAEWSNRLDLHGNVNLSGTERLLFSMRPLDSRTGDYTGYNLHPQRDDGWQQEFNARLTELFFEGDFGEIFPGLDPTDSHTFDVGFSVGREPVVVQDGLLLNDIIDLVGITRNSLVFPGVSNLRLTGIYSWNHISRGNNDPGADSINQDSAQLFGLLSEADTAWNNTLSLDLIYVDDDRNPNAWYLGAASTQRFGALNTTFRVDASIPEDHDTQAVSSGIVLLSQLSSTLRGSDNIVYFNTFWDIDRFTSAARGPDQGNPVANLGILYAPVGMGRYGEPLGQPIEDTVGMALGYQMFLHGIDSQLILELGARTSTKSGDEGVLGFGARYQRAIGRHHVLRLDSFVAGQEGNGPSYGLRVEWMVKF